MANPERKYSERDAFGPIFDALREGEDRDITEGVGKTATKFGVSQATGDYVSGHVASELMDDETAHNVGSAVIAGGLVAGACIASVLAPFALLGYGAFKAIEHVIEES